MKLDAEDGLRPVRQGHDEPVVAARRDGELGGQTVFADHERMVPPGLERARDAVEERGPVVAHGRALAVPRRGRALDDAAVERRDRLVAEADAEQRDAGALGRRRSSRSSGPHSRAGPGPGEITIARGRSATTASGSNRSLRATSTPVVELPERLHEVVGEGVVVVDDEDHDGTCAGNHSRARSMARKRAAALDSASAYSFSGIGVGDDAGAGLDAPDPLLDDRRADRDRQVAVAGGVEVADRAAVDPPPRGFERVDELHGADLRRAGQRARPESTRPARPRRVRPAASAPADLGDEVLHVRELLDGRVARDAHAADLADAAQVVAREIDEHHVLGPLLGVGQQRARPARVLLRRRAARQRCPRSGRVSTSRPRQRTSISGEEPRTLASRVSR